MHAVHPGDGVADHLRTEHYVLTRVFSVQWWLTPPMKARTLWLPAWQSEILRVVPAPLGMRIMLPAQRALAHPQSTAENA
jgi:hypothetical protein